MPNVTQLIGDGWGLHLPLPHDSRIDWRVSCPLKGKNIMTFGYIKMCSLSAKKSSRNEVSMNMDILSELRQKVPRVLCLETEELKPQ